MMTELCFCTKMNREGEMECDISMSLSGEDGTAWLELLKGSGRLELFDGRHRVIIEDVPGGGEEWTAREPFSSSRLS